MTDGDMPTQEKKVQHAISRTPIIIVLLMGAFLPRLDFYIVNLALPVIGNGLRTTGGQLQLIVSGYASAYAVFLITGSRVPSKPSKILSSFCSVRCDGCARLITVRRCVSKRIVDVAAIVRRCVHESVEIFFIIDRL
jgi:hypothetical protein